MPHYNNQGSPKHWISDPVPGQLFAGQTCSSGEAPANGTCSRLVVLSAGSVYLIPVGKDDADEVLWDAAALRGDVIDQQCDGIGSSSSATVNAQFG